MVEEEDTQPLTKPIVAPIKEKKFQSVERAQPATAYSTGLIFVNFPDNIFLLRISHFFNGCSKLNKKHCFGWSTSPRWEK